MSTITSHKLSLTCIRIHLKKCYVLLILLMMCSSLPMLGEEQYKWMNTLDKVTLERFQSMLSEAYHPDISNRIDSFVSVAEREKDWRKTYLAYKLKAYNLSGKGMVEEAAKSAGEQSPLSSGHTLYLHLLPLSGTGLPPTAARRQGEVLYRQGGTLSR